ncbi:MAG: helix-turn-helix domain-containing protein [Clostridium butyricum]|nr:helix-turn-helix domain-containing protein [Clostridium butyricum]
MYNVIMKEYTDRITDQSKKSISDFVFYNCGIEQCKPCYKYGPKAREYHFIHFIIDGEGTLEINNMTYSVHKNQLFIIPAGEVSTYMASYEHPWTYCWIGFLGIQSNHYIQSILNYRGSDYVFDCQDTSYYMDKIKTILDFSNNKLSSLLKINGVMYDIIGNLLEESGVDFIDNFDISIESQAIRYMDLHYYDDIQITDVADYLGVHANYLTNIFKKKYHITPKQYLIDLKIRKAKKMLLETDYPIYIIASSVGYSDPLAFSKYFRKKTNLSPKQFRERGK